MYRTLMLLVALVSFILVAGCEAKPEEKAASSASATKDVARTRRQANDDNIQSGK